jgi:hypothetical protein
MLYRKYENKTKIIAATFAAIILSGLILITIKSFNPEPNSSPENLFWAYFESISTENAELYKKCLHPVDLIGSKFNAKYADKNFNQIIEYNLKRINSNLSTSYSANWFNNLEIISIEESEIYHRFAFIKYHYKDIPIGQSYIEVYNIDGKYYLYKLDNYPLN